MNCIVCGGEVVNFEIEHPIPDHERIIGPGSKHQHPQRETQEDLGCCEDCGLVYYTPAIKK